MGARNRRWVGHGALAVGLLGAALAVYSWQGTGGDATVPAGETRTPAAPDGAGTVARATAGPSVVATQAPASETLAAARALYREGRYGEARAAFFALATASSDPEERANAYIGAATAAFDLNDEGFGLEALALAVKSAPANASPSITARYLLLKKFNDLGRTADAAAAFSAAPRPPANAPLAPYYEFEGGRATWATGGRELWDALRLRPGVSTALKETILRENVSRWRAAGDQGGLVRALDALIAATADADARVERALLAQAQGDSATFAAQLRAVVEESPGAPAAGVALEKLAEAGVAVDPGFAGLSYYRRGLYTRARDVLLPSVATAPAANAVAFRAYYLAASYEDLGDAANAVRYYDIAANSGATSPFVHRAMYWAARVTEEAGPVTAASQRYVQLAHSAPGEFTQEAAFRAGYVLLESGDSAGALAAWDGLAGGSSARLEYWRGKALQKAHDTPGANAAFGRAVALGPLDLYGMEAARELGRGVPFDVTYRERDFDQPVDWAVISSWLSLKIGGAPRGSGPTAACDLMTAGLRGAAAAEIRAADASADAWREFELMREAHDCGLTDVAAQLAVALRTEVGVASHDPPRDLLRVSYPIDFGATVNAEARKAGIDPLFFAAVIRQESFWDPAAHSVADARGLTQVIPPTAEALAGALSVVDFQESDLFRPALSLEFGAYYLGEQVREYGNALFALAAYNAGPANAHRWQASGASTPAQVVESIDFVETTAYVTYIFEAYAHYRRAWTGE